MDDPQLFTPSCLSNHPTSPKPNQNHTHKPAPFCHPLSLSHTHTRPDWLPILEMHVLVAASVSGSFAFLSHFPSSSSDNASQNALPLTSLNLSNCWTKRPTLLSPAKVSVSSGSTTETDDGVDQSSFTDDYRQTRVCFCVCMILNFSFSMLP